MKKLLKNNYFSGLLLLALSVVVFFLGLWTINTKLPVYSLSLWGLCLPANMAFDGMHIYSLVYVICFFLSLVFIGLSLLSLFKRKNLWFIITIIYQIALQIGLLVLRGLAKETITNSMVGLSIASLVLLLFAFAVMIIRKINVVGEKISPVAEEEVEVPLAPGSKKGAISILVMNIISLIIVFATLLFPLYVDKSGGEVITHILLAYGSYSSISIIDTIFCLVFLCLFLGSAFYFMYTLSVFISDKRRFVRMSKSFSIYNLLIIIAFFLSGFIISFSYSLLSIPTYTYSYVLLIVYSICLFLFSIFKGRFEGLNNIHIRSRKLKYFKVETLVYIILISLATLSCLLLRVVVVNFDTPAVHVSLTGIQLIQQYAKLDSGYQILTFYIVCLVLISGVFLIWGICCYFTKYRFFNRVAKVIAYVNAGLVLSLGLWGLYFVIVIDLNTQNIATLLESFGYTYDSSMTYSVHTDMLYAAIFDIALLVLMFFRKSFDKEPFALTGIDSQEMPAIARGDQAGEEAIVTGNDEGMIGQTAGEGSGVGGNGAPADELLPNNFDPCPGFSNLDGQVEAFKADLEKRKEERPTSVSLNGLVSFIVEYARDSRLHLSYSKQDIAAFVSGLGACRLSILQGMSGTGKTSLPKIFMEAIHGNCFLVEVESSWKDKNELLGYYNEFSNMYTPKKFTLDVYKTALNSEIPTFIVLDEMNLSRIEYYFSDFLSLMENEEDKREIKLCNIKLARREDGVDVPYSLLNDGYSLKIPANLWFVGTANRDESTFVISDKVYDRAHTMNFNHRAPKIKDETTPIPQEFYTYSMLKKLLDDAKEKGNFDAEASPLIQEVEKILRPFNISFGNRILNQIEDFVNIYTACFPKADVQKEAVETILLSKVVAKLEVKTIDNKEELIRAFEDLKLSRCAEFISSLNED